MSDTLKKLKQYRDELAGDLFDIEVEEIGETWKASRSISLRDLRRIIAVEDEIDRALETVLVLTKDEHGKRLFTDSNKADIESLPPMLVVNVAKAIWDQLNLPSAEDAEKKS